MRRYASGRRVSVCMSVGLSQAGTVPERLNVGSCKQRRTIVQGAEKLACCRCLGGPRARTMIKMSHLLSVFGWSKISYYDQNVSPVVGVWVVQELVL